MDERIIQIKKITKQLDLNLEGLTILTEVGSNVFGLIGIIAALAKAKKVICWTKDSDYGSGKENIDALKTLVTKWEINDVFEFAINERPLHQIGQADIITNSGFTRPFDENFISTMKPSSVIATMMEKWELRATDIEIDSCLKYNIKVAGTWENHPQLKIFDQCGPLAEKLILEAGLSIKGKHITILSNDGFGKVVNDHLRTAYSCEIKICNPFDGEQIPINTDILVVADFTHDGDMLTSFWGNVNSFKRLNKTIVHLCGEANKEKLNSFGYKIYPNYSGYSRKMSKTLAYLGDEPVIKLHAAGLKVGESLYKGEDNSIVQRIC